MTSESPFLPFIWEEGLFLYMSIETTYDKPFRTYEEMIKIMESRNIIVADKAFAEMALRNFSYYGLVNGYKNTFLQADGTDNFAKNTKFEELYTLHIIDIGLNNVLFKYIIFLEKALKSRLSYLVPSKYGVYTNPNDKKGLDDKDYLSKVHYSNSNNKRSDILWKLKNNISTQRHNPSISHYITEKNHVPAWILTTNISYGLAIEWYGILYEYDKEYICNTFIVPGKIEIDLTKEFLRKCFDLTKEYRNKIAHGNRTFNIQNLPVLPKESLLPLSYNSISEIEYNNHLGQNDTMAVILVIMILLDDPYLNQNFMKEIFDVFNPYKDVKFTNNTIFQVFGLPTNIFDRMDKLFQARFT